MVTDTEKAEVAKLHKRYNFIFAYRATMIAVPCLALFYSIAYFLLRNEDLSLFSLDWVTSSSLWITLFAALCKLLYVLQGMQSYTLFSQFFR